MFSYKISKKKVLKLTFNKAFNLFENTIEIQKLTMSVYASALFKENKNDNNDDNNNNIIDLTEDEVEYMKNLKL